MSTAKTAPHGSSERAHSAPGEVHNDTLCTLTLPPADVCQRARTSRDPRFDGRFFVGVLSTGVYCRPICPARVALEANVRYYPSAAAAHDAGFRPCRRCRPETARRLPDWTIGSDTVLRAVRLIEAGYLNEHSVARLAGALGLGERQLSRLFQQQLGSSPKRVAQMHRARLARRLLESSQLKLADVAFHAGYGSLSRFNSEMRSIFHCAPRELRKQRGRATPAAARVVLPVRGPYHFDWVFTYLRTRALAGIETVTGEPGSWRYVRRLGDGAELVVTQQGEELVAELPVTDEPMHSLLRRVRRVFDLDADGATVHDSLVNDARLAPFVAAAPGLRVAGAWDGFELAVRAVLGQQVSVVRGKVLADALVERFGAGAFPGPAQLADADVSAIGMPGQRGAAVRGLAQAVLSGALEVDECQDYDAQHEALLAIDGIGPWTANYIRMRALRDPDAFPDNDWVVMKELDSTAAAARRQATAWQPWRAYALMYLWYAAGQRRERESRERKARKRAATRR